MLVGQPIPLSQRILLGATCILLLIGAYTIWSETLSYRKREEVAKKLPPLKSELQTIEAQLASNPDDSDLVEAKQDLQDRISRVERDVLEAKDRRVPTWKTLYTDGLLRVTEGQGLKKNEYWLWEDSKATASRLISGMLAGVVLSLGLGILMGAYSPIEAFFLPTLSFLAKIPPTAMLVVFFILVGVGEDMYVTMIVFGMLPTLAIAVFQSAKKDVPESLIYKAYTLGGSDAELIWNVIFKQILPRMIDAVRLQLGPAMVLLVAAEWMVAGEGFGYRLRLFYQRTDMSVPYLYLMILGVAGLTMDYMLIFFRRYLCPWFGE